MLLRLFLELFSALQRLKFPAYSSFLFLYFTDTSAYHFL